MSYRGSASGFCLGSIQFWPAAGFTNDADPLFGNRRSWTKICSSAFYACLKGLGPVRTTQRGWATSQELCRGVRGFTQHVDTQLTSIHAFQTACCYVPFPFLLQPARKRGKRPHVPPQAAVVHSFVISFVTRACTYAHDNSHFTAVSHVKL